MSLERLSLYALEQIELEHAKFFIPPRNSATTGGVPRAVYISFIVIMSCAGFLGLLLLPPHKLRRDDGSIVAANPPRSAWEEFRSNLLILKDWKLLMMFPAFLPAECFLVYSGSVNGKLKSREFLIY